MANNGRTAAKARSAQVLRNSPRAMPLFGFTNFCESAWMFSFLRCEAVLLATMILITEYGWLKMLSLSVNMWCFTDKYFKINNLSVRGRVFTDKITFREATINRNSRGAHKKMRCVTRNEANTELDWIEQPACRNLAYGTECQVDMTSSQMQVMWKSG